MKKPIRQMNSNEKPFVEEKKPEKEVATYSVVTKEQEVRCSNSSEALIIQSKVKGIIWAIINNQYCYTV